MPSSPKPREAGVFLLLSLFPDKRGNCDSKKWSCFYKGPRVVVEIPVSGSCLPVPARSPPSPPSSWTTASPSRPCSPVSSCLCPCPSSSENAFILHFSALAPEPRPRCLVQNQFSLDFPAQNELPIPTPHPGFQRLCTVWTRVAAAASLEGPCCG